MLWLTVHLSPSGNNTMLSIALAQTGLIKEDDTTWVAEIPSGEPIVNKFDIVCEMLANFFPVPVPVTLKEWNGLPIDLMYRLYKSVGAFAVVEVRERERLLFQRVWLECDLDMAVLAS